MTHSLLWAPPPAPLESPTINSTIVPLWYPAPPPGTPHSLHYVRGMGIPALRPPATPSTALYPPLPGQFRPYHHTSCPSPCGGWAIVPLHSAPSKSPCKIPSKSPLIFLLEIRPYFIPLFPPPKLPPFSQEVGNCPRSRVPVGNCPIHPPFPPLTYSLVPSVIIIPPYKHPA